MKTKIKRALDSTSLLHSTRRLLCLPLIVSFILLSNGCSTYTTNSKITFTSTELSGLQPEIYIGEITETPDQITFLGSVEATVRKPSMFDDDPTKEMANMILGSKGRELEADAIIHPKYRKSTFGWQITATGQAVKINTANSYNLKKDSVQKALEKFGITTDEPTTGKTTTTAAPAPLAPAFTALPALTDSLETRGDANQPAKVAPMQRQAPDEKVIALAKALAKAEADAQARAEEAKANEEFRQLDAMADIDAINFMISNARLLMDAAIIHKDKGMEASATRLIQMLEHHREKHQRQSGTGQ